MTPEQRRRLIARYAEGYDQVAAALQGFPADLTVHHPFPGKWSAREIVHHLGDSETLSALRLRRLLTEEHPVIAGYDQDRWAILLRYNLRDHGPALEAFRRARENTMQLLPGLTDEDWERAGWHSQSGLYTAERWLEIYADHAHRHAEQIVKLKEALAKR